MKSRFELALLSLGSFVTLALGGSHASAATRCESLAALALPHATITTAQGVTGGSFTPPGATAPLTGLPDFCRVAGTSAPTADSNIGFEVWLPIEERWNRKYLQLGCGGFCGGIVYAGLAGAIRRGYAAAATDDGSQTAGSPLFALGHPEKIVDFGYRALTETTEKTRAILRAFTGRRPRRSYFAGCSDGGREALLEAQRFPEDFDGIIAGAPASFWTHQFAGFVWNEQALLADPASFLPSTLLPVLTRAVLAQCAGRDGGLATDSFLTDPRACPFDPASVQCAPGQDPATCLTAAQVSAVRKIYRGPHDPRDGRRIFPGFEPGSEASPLSWPAWITGARPGAGAQQFYGNGFFADFVFQDPTWTFDRFDFGTDVALTDARLGGIFDAVDPDLRTFERRGGKLIQYAGWADAAVAPRSNIAYYERVQAARQRDPRDFYRLFMVPGMAHCAGGDGPDAFGNGVDGPVVDADHDLLMALDRWVEEGTPPRAIVATHYVDDDPARGVAFQRPLCPFPEVASFEGGDAASAASFRCKGKGDGEPEGRP